MQSPPSTSDVVTGTSRARGALRPWPGIDYYHEYDCMCGFPLAVTRTALGLAHSPLGKLPQQVGAAATPCRPAAHPAKRQPRSPFPASHRGSCPFALQGIASIGMPRPRQARPRLPVGSYVRGTYPWIRSRPHPTHALTPDTTSRSRPLSTWRARPASPLPLPASPTIKMEAREGRPCGSISAPAASRARVRGDELSQCV